MENSDIFVYGANGHGSFVTNVQRHANKYYGAMYGIANGMNGSAYAIAIRDTKMEKRNLLEIKRDIDKFVAYADRNPKKIFKVTTFPGFAIDEIAPLFVYSPNNVILPMRYKTFIEWDGIKRKYWMA